MTSKNKEKKELFRTGQKPVELSGKEKVTLLGPVVPTLFVGSKSPDLPIVYDSLQQWRLDAVSRFGKDSMNWKFKCPACGHIASAQDFKDAGAEMPMRAAYVCIGSLSGVDRVGNKEGTGPCSFIGAGKENVNPVKIEGSVVTYFDFAPGAKKKRAPRKKAKDVE